MNDPFSYKQNLSSNDLIQDHSNINIIDQTLSNSQHIQEDAYISQQYNEQNKHA